MRQARGFTMVELAVAVSLLAIVVPAVYVMERSLETEQRKVLAQLEAARSMRSISETLRRDLWTMRWVEGEALVLSGRGPCEKVIYALDDRNVLMRQGAGHCGPAQALARNVAEITRTPLGVEVVFATRVAAQAVVETRMLMGLAPAVPK